MELKFFIGPAISFVLALIAFVPLVKYRIKATEKKAEKQARDIKKNEDENRRLELLILEKGNDSSNKAMAKMADAMLLVAESNSRFDSIIASQNLLIQKANEASTRAHSRIDEVVKDTQHEIDSIKEKFVSHKHFDTVMKLKDQ